MVQACHRIEHVGDVVILSAGGANAAARSLAFASQASAPNSAAGLPAMIGQRALGVRRKRRFLVAPLAAALILPAASPALGANTDIYPDFGFASPWLAVSELFRRRQSEERHRAVQPVIDAGARHRGENCRCARVCDAENLLRRQVNDLDDRRQHLEVL